MARLRHLFIVRIWQEPDSVGEAVWRGSIENPPAANPLYFTRLADLLDFIQLRLDGPPQSQLDILPSPLLDTLPEALE